MSDHTVKAFDEDITRLRGLIAEMGGLAEVAIQEAMESLARGDEELANAVVERDKNRGRRRADRRLFQEYRQTGRFDRYARSL